MAKKKNNNKPEIRWIWSFSDSKYYREVDGVRTEISREQFAKEALEEPNSFDVDYGKKDSGSKGS